MRGGGGNADTGVGGRAEGGSIGSSAAFSSSGGVGAGRTRAFALRVDRLAGDGADTLALGCSAESAFEGSAGTLFDGSGGAVCDGSGDTLFGGSCAETPEGPESAAVTGAGSGSTGGADWQSAVADRMAAKRRSSAIPAASCGQRLSRGKGALRSRRRSGQDIVSRFVTVLSGFPIPQWRSSLRTRISRNLETTEKSSCTRVWQNSIIPRWPSHPPPPAMPHVPGSSSGMEDCRPGTTGSGPYRARTFAVRHGTQNDRSAFTRRF